MAFPADEGHHRAYTARWGSKDGIERSDGDFGAFYAGIILNDSELIGFDGLPNDN